MTLHTIASIVARQYIEPNHSPLFDTARQVARMNVAFGLSGIAHIQPTHSPCSPKTWAENYDDAMDGLRCEHVHGTNEDFLTQASVKIRDDGSINMDDVREAVLRAHDNIENWIACKYDVSIDSDDKRKILSTLLPLTNILDKIQVKNVLNVCHEYHCLNPSFLCDAKALKYVRSLFYSCDSISLADIAECLTPQDKYKEVVIHLATQWSSSTLLQKHLESTDIDPIQGAMQRATLVRSSYNYRPSCNLVQECTDFIMTGSSSHVIDKLKSREFLIQAVMEEAEENDVQHHGYLLSAIEYGRDDNEVAEIMLTVIQTKSFDEEACSLDMSIDYTFHNEFYEILEVYDLIDDYTGNDILDIYFKDKHWEPYEKSDEFFCKLEFMRTIFDNFNNMVRTFKALRCHKFKEYITYNVCKEYVFCGEYNGPSMSWCCDTVECVCIRARDIYYKILEASFRGVNLSESDCGSDIDSDILTDDMHS